MKQIYTNKIIKDTGEEFGYVRYIPIDENLTSIQNEPEIPPEEMEKVFEVMRNLKISALKVRFNRVDF